jgi:hypothetical protein
VSELAELATATDPVLAKIAAELMPAAKAAQERLAKAAQG